VPAVIAKDGAMRIADHAGFENSDAVQVGAVSDTRIILAYVLVAIATLGLIYAASVSTGPAPIDFANMVAFP
jgi:hypothetical protein